MFRKAKLALRHISNVYKVENTPMMATHYRSVIMIALVVFNVLIPICCYSADGAYCEEDPPKDIFGIKLLGKNCRSRN